MNRAAPHCDEGPARCSDGRSATAPVDPVELLAGREADGLRSRVHAAVSAYAHGVALPSAADLAHELGERWDLVQLALSDLESAGELVLRARRFRYRLRPEELHPKDVDFDRAVREGIAALRYAPGTPLPTGLLSRHHSVSPLHVARACRRLVADRLVTHRDGHAGPGYYVTPPTGTTDQPTNTERGEDTDRG